MESSSFKKKSMSKGKYYTANNRKFVFTILIYLITVYSIYLFLDTNTIIKIGREDGLFEYLSFFFFIGASLFFLMTYLLRKNIFYLLFALIFFIGAGEEISWGQRIFLFSTPESLSKINVQNEFTLHNIELFNTHDFDHNIKTGWSKFLTVNFAYKLFWLSFGIILPLIVLLNKKLFLLTIKLKVPVPPLSIGIFFLVNWILFRIVITYFLKTDQPFLYYFSINEVMESGSALIFFILSYIFYTRERKLKAY